MWHVRLSYADCLDIAYLCTKFNDSSFSHSRETIGAPNFKMGHVTIIMPLSGMICRPWAMTYYNKPSTKFEVSTRISTGYQRHTAYHLDTVLDLKTETNLLPTSQTVYVRWTMFYWFSPNIWNSLPNYLYLSTFFGAIQSVACLHVTNF